MSKTISDCALWRSLLQKETELRATEQLRATQREKALRAEMQQTIEGITNQADIKYKALKRERDTLLNEVESLKRTDSANSDGNRAEKADDVQMGEKMDELQKEIEDLKLQLHEQKNLQLRDAEMKRTLHRQIRDLEERVQKEHDECADLFIPKLKALRRENTFLKSQNEEMKIRHDDLSFKNSEMTANDYIAKRTL